MSYPRALIFSSLEEYYRADKMLIQNAYLVAYRLYLDRYFITKNKIHGVTGTIHKSSIGYQIDEATKKLQIFGVKV